MSLARRVVTSVVVAVVTMAGIAVASPDALASNASTLYSLTNASRASAGLAAYAYSGELSAVAQSRAQSMVAHNALTHAGLASAVGNWSYLGENVGYGPSAAALEVAFMNSPDHRANILDHDFTQVGIGTVTVGGTVWVSVIFRKPLHSSSSGGGQVRPAGHLPAKQATTSPGSATISKPAPGRAAAAVASPAVHGLCSVSPVEVQQILGLAGEAHTVRLVAQSQRLVLSFQCGRGLPMTGLLDQVTLAALTS